MKLLDLCKSAQEFDQSDMKIISVNDTLEEYVDRIIPGLHNLKKTYEGESNLIAKIESIILTFIDYKDFLEKERIQKQIREQKQKQKQKQKQTQTQTQNNTGYKNIKIITTSNNQQEQLNEKEIRTIFLLISRKRIQDIQELPVFREKNKNKKLSF